jgi:hypothetical protein
MQLYRRGSLAHNFTTLWYQGLSEIQRLRFVVQVISCMGTMKSKSAIRVGELVVERGVK